jgi:hypothetical protein
MVYAISKENLSNYIAEVDFEAVRFVLHPGRPGQAVP